MNNIYKVGMTLSPSLMNIKQQNYVTVKLVNALLSEERRELRLDGVCVCVLNLPQTETHGHESMTARESASLTPQELPGDFKPPGIRSKGYIAVI